MKVWEGGSEMIGMAQRIHCEPVIGTWRGREYYRRSGRKIEGGWQTGDRREAYGRSISNWCYPGNGRAIGK